MTTTIRATATERADELLRQMTIEEKTMQLSSVFPLALFTTEGPNHSQLDKLLKNGIGHVSALGLIGHKAPEQLAKWVNAIQHYLATETRLKIPAIFHNEAMCGVVAPHFTAFPTPVGLAAAWDPAAVQEMADLERLVGFSDPRGRQAKDLDRDLGLFNLIQNKHYSYAEAVEEWNRLHPESDFDADLSRRSALMRRLCRERQPRWKKAGST